jgi:hypothetical protein
MTKKLPEQNLAKSSQFSRSKTRGAEPLGAPPDQTTLTAHQNKQSSFLHCEESEYKWCFIGAYYNNTSFAAKYVADLETVSRFSLSPQFSKYSGHKEQLAVLRFQ